ncbi:MAG: site-2 protease family protein [Treponema sp.]|nr:site-2 protease family protein [Treponema sp.]
MKWLYGYLCLFFLIVFHEFGHFIAAKIFGVKVESFSVGFGPVLLHKNIKGTDWRLSLIPLGGYCGMKGEKDFQYAIENNLDSVEGEKDSLYGVHPIKRALIGFAGPFFNFIFAIFALSIINFIGYEYSTYSNKILIEPEKYTNNYSAAGQAGLISGDIILEINGKSIEDFTDIIKNVTTHPDEDLLFKVQRDGKIMDFIVHSELDKSQGTGKIGVSADTSSIITKHTPKYNFFEASWHGLLDSFSMTGITLKGLSLLFKGIDLKNAVSGPARVTEMLGSTVKDGFSAGFKSGLISTLDLMAIISISLFIMNLLPIPVLDGGLILIALIELIFRKKIKPKIQYYIQFIGLGFIAIIFVIGLTGDITYFIHKGK